MQQQQLQQEQQEQQQQQQRAPGHELPLRAASPNAFSGHPAAEQSPLAHPTCIHGGDSQQAAGAAGGLTPRQQQAAAW
jgi:hypothetical protein